MNKETNIINRIISDASMSAENLVLEAKKKAAGDFECAKWNVERSEIKTVAAIKISLKAEAEQVVKVAGLNVKKENLQEKRSLLDQVFSEAKKELLSLKDKEYRDIIKKLISEHSREDDIIIISKNDEKKFSEEFIKTFKKKLTRKVSSDIEDGIIIQNKSFDKVLTIDSILKTVRQNIEAEVARELFE